MTTEKQKADKTQKEQISNIWKITKMKLFTLFDNTDVLIFNPTPGHPEFWLFWFFFIESIQGEFYGLSLQPHHRVFYFFLTPKGKI